MSCRYELVDFGDGRKLESLAGRLVDRPSPAAVSASRREPKLWRQADSRFDLMTKAWDHRTPWPEDTAIDAIGVDDQPWLRFPVQPTPFGHIGVFPEQEANWRWLQDSDSAGESSGRSSVPQALNLFAYTGGSTMALARAGFQVAHVDAAKPNVEAAKRLAQANGLGDAPVRYLVDDALAFVQREIRRGNRYHTIVMDPPAYGHGPKSKRKKRTRSADGEPARPAKQAKAWRIQRDLPELLTACLDLVTSRSFRILVTGHSAEMDQADVLDLLRRKIRNRRIGRLEPVFEAGRMSLPDRTGRSLDAGFFVRCSLNC
ncbi:23S rRNA (cytosine1962-C5)-methyltransferase [Neorhodopirellula lusitana]|uniref:23S rRNA (Cytosine1962-C5)-methyltransferase n=1 Tax=Neorhodopirellula lusitana TaxID=445327 RepID=A0ABY1QJE2_9BACT|nr:class I SAM-dependent methyltransferase [Neorhodopirellula lusitana]SMP73048.1 23S rRNA (cytosine1962-C5)-methyltransferase [Neorhodopirellula lusitana]